ncbi:MAG: protease complex subunit PrcB family protein [Acetatifactor sp.]|nr:protease complex subunit PrcB family protein [Acetatifactor sp.]
MSHLKAKILLCIAMAAATLLLAGCTFLSEETIKLRDLDFTVLSEEKVPEELLTIIEEKKASPFQITYSDNEYLYICVGYGEHETGGYSIAVNELYLTETNICANTSLLGPDASEKPNKTPSYPYIVIKTEYLDQTVIFE